MINPVLTILFDLFLIGSALAVTAAMVGEYLGGREPHVGGARKARTPRGYSAPRRGATVHRFPERRRAA